MPNDKERLKDIYKHMNNIMDMDDDECRRLEDEFLKRSISQ